MIQGGQPTADSRRRTADGGQLGGWLRQLHYSDNLFVLREMESEFVDLVYLDPPFNSNRAYNIIYDDKIQTKAFEDTWRWNSHCDVYLEELRKGDKTSTQAYDILHALISAMGKIQLCAYLVNMGIRLIEMRRVLKNTGSIYLHCDPTASHYLKILMDCVFGQDNFRNEIIWHYSAGHSPKNKFKKKHDVILFYSKSKNSLFREPRMPYAEKDLYRFNLTDETGKKYRINHIKDVNGEYKRFYWDKGTPCDDVWTYTRDGFNQLGSTSPERLGYPTQKPLALLERIIQASSKEGDLVLDPFCGCGTTVAAAEIHGRQWIGIDITWLAVAAIKERFKRQKLDVWGKIERLREPKSPEEVKKTMIDIDPSLRARREFEKYCVETIDGHPNDKMGADGGIDGRIKLKEGKQAIVSVKSGRVSVKDVRELKGILKDNQPIGILITYEPPTRDMVAFANKSGIYKGKDDLMDRDDSRIIPIIQIFTQKDLFRGKRPILPQ